MVGRREIQKDTVQMIAESAALHVGRIATIVSGTVREVMHEFGDWASDIFEMREAADRARRADSRRAFDDDEDEPGHVGDGQSGDERGGAVI